jgi:hypothetical protein
MISCSVGLAGFRIGYSREFLIGLAIDIAIGCVPFS